MKLCISVCAAKLSLVFLAATWAGVEAATAPTLESLTNDLRRIESVREVKNIQKTYAQLAFHGRWADMAALFADDGILRWGQGKAGANLLSNEDAVDAKGPAAIEKFLKTSAGDIDGIKPGSLHALINDQPLISLSADGKTAKGRYHSIQMMGDGKGKSKIQGGLMENKYVLTTSSKGDVWRIKLLRYFPQYIGDYNKGWINVGNNSLPIVPYHYTAESSGTPIILPDSAKNKSSGLAPLSFEELQYRITRLNDEDEIRNLQHIYGHYVDRRMWPEVTDLYAPEGDVSSDGKVISLKDLLATMGPSGLTRGILNEHPIFQMTVEISPDGLEATTRGLEIGMIGDYDAKTAEWRFVTFRNKYVKDPNTNIWKIKRSVLVPRLHANYSSGWAYGGTLRANTAADPPLAFLNLLGHLSNTSQRPQEWLPTWREENIANETVLHDLERRLKRSTAWDESENVSSAYGYYTDDVRCVAFATLHADKGFKESPGVGWYRTPERIAKACQNRYGEGTNNSVLRSSVPIHLRLQPVILVSQDGRSSTSRIRNLQIGTSRGTAARNFVGSNGFNGGMYHDQFVLEEKNGVSRRKLWSLVIDEFYWNSGSWVGGWSSINSTARKLRRGEQFSSVQRRQAGIGGYIADLALTDPGMGPREIGFNGGPPPTVRWPNIQRMWWASRNLVTGRVPDSYWPGCVPCQARPDWSLMANGYQEPATGPTLVNATADGLKVTATITGGPGEPVAGVVQLRRGNRSGNLVGEARLTSSGGNTASFSVQLDSTFAAGPTPLDVFFLGSDRLQPGKARVTIDVPSPLR
ncbi:SnoaL-like domain-containing protein [Podospora aff. communis PSN243]|uniref:SnoaL-like domain-containing protein n=1 Tax=Podospora aff. communis PSN243 TaxID=3040156 RepID=A0AAV9GBM7_9PEZI|nr:SnoaL-like domain-containing protein [Podospora aff. communis PSN243]